MATVGFQCSVRGIEVTFQGTQWLLLASPLIGHMSPQSMPGSRESDVPQWAPLCPLLSQRECLMELREMPVLDDTFSWPLCVSHWPQWGLREGAVLCPKRWLCSATDLRDRLTLLYVT